MIYLSAGRSYGNPYSSSRSQNYDDIYHSFPSRSEIFDSPLSFASGVEMSGEDAESHISLLFMLANTSKEDTQCP